MLPQTLRILKLQWGKNSPNTIKPWCDLNWLKAIVFSPLLTPVYHLAEMGCVIMGLSGLKSRWSAWKLPIQQWILRQKVSFCSKGLRCIELCLPINHFKGIGRKAGNKEQTWTVWLSHAGHSILMQYRVLGINKIQHKLAFGDLSSFRFYSFLAPAP